MKTVIEMALNSGDEEWRILVKQVMKHFPDEFEHFAEIVRADMKERCAKMCDQLAIEDGLHQAKFCANAIRGRMDE